MSCSQRSGPPKVLVFSKTSGFYHNSIPDGIEAIQKLGEENGFEVDTTTNASKFTEDTLKQYSAVIFLSTTGDVLDKYQEADFERYIQAGGGYVGIHAAADTEYEWGWYGRMVGGYFLDHPGINDPHPTV
jgi:type 1 glutamine amidotransferase